MAKPRVGILPYKMVEKASKDLPWDAAFALVYLWTCPHRRIGGLFRLPLGYMASDLDISASEAKDKMTLLEGKGYIAYESGVVYLRGYMQAQNKFQGKVSLDTAKGMASDIAEIEPPKRLLSLWESEARSIPALLESLINQGYVPLSESESESESESGRVHTECIPSMCPAPAEYVEGAHQVRSEYIPSTYSVGTQYIPGYVPSGIGSGTGSGSENINIKDLRISNEIREDFSSSSSPDSERDILSEATEYDSTGSVGFTGLETVSGSKRKIAVDGNDRNRNGSDSTEKDAGMKDKDLEDCEKDHEPVCALESQKLQGQQISRRLRTSQTTGSSGDVSVARSCGGDASVGVPGDASGDISSSKRKTSFSESDINDAGGENGCRAGEDAEDHDKDLDDLVHRESDHEPLCDTELQSLQTSSSSKRKTSFSESDVEDAEAKSGCGEDLVRHGSDRKPVCVTGPRLKTSSGFKKQAGSGCGGASDCDIRAGCGGCEADSARSDADRKTSHALDLADARSCDVKLQSSQTAESSFKRKMSRDGYGEPSAHGRICEYREANREPDLAAETSFCGGACGLGDSGGSSFCASAHAHACDGRRTSRAQEDASVPASEDVSGAASGNAPADVPVLDDDVGGHERRSPNPCPHKDIVAIYHEVLPELRRVCAWNATREKHLRARWREDKRRQSLSWWREYFTRVKASSFLTGKKTDWSADFDWLIRPTNMAKVLEGKYDDSPQSHERAPQKTGTNVETLFRELVSSWPADRVGDVQAAKKTFCSVIDVGIEEGNRRLKNLESWALVVLEREPKYVPRLDKWLAGLDVSIPPPESRQCECEWVPVARACAVEDGELEAVAS